MGVGRWSMSVTLTHKLIYYAHFHSVIKYEIIWGGGGGNSSNSGHIYNSQNEIIILWMMHNPKFHLEAYLKNRDFTGSMPY